MSSDREGEMNVDDVLAYLAAKAKSERPAELRSDSRMLAVWLKLRNCKRFRDDILRRHNLQDCSGFDSSSSCHEHAIANAWGQCVEAALGLR